MQKIEWGIQDETGKTREFGVIEFPVVPRVGELLWWGQAKHRIVEIDYTAVNGENGAVVTRIGIVTRPVNK